MTSGQDGGAEMKNGWYKITSGNNVFVRYFANGLTSNGYAARDFEKMRYTLEPVVVMTEEEWSNRVAQIQTIAYGHGFNAGQGLKG